MADDTEADKKIANLQKRMLEMEGIIKQLVAAAKEHAKAIKALNTAVTRQTIRR